MTRSVYVCVYVCVCVRVIHSRTEVSSLYEIENLSTWGMELRPFQYVTDWGRTRRCLHEKRLRSKLVCVSMIAVDEFKTHVLYTFYFFFSLNTTLFGT